MYTALLIYDIFYLNSGKYPAPPGASEILGLEVAGEIAEVGDSAKNIWKVGDKVMGKLSDNRNNNIYTEDQF